MEKPASGQPVPPGASHLARSADLATSAPEALSQIRVLQIDRCDDVAALARLRDLPKLEVLRLGGLTGVADLQWLPALPQLTALRIEGFGDALTSLHGIAAVPALTALVVDPRGGRAVLHSLEPLAELDDLRLLLLPAIATSDASLRALVALKKLELFHGTAYYGPDEYEALAAALPQLRCPWFSDAAWQLL